MMARVGTPSLDQLDVFLAVVETGSFAAAGRRLGRATSAISYTIGNLERQLGVGLFDRSLARTPVLTQSGQAIRAKAERIRAGIDELRASIEAVGEGIEPELVVVVDVMLPSEWLVRAVRAFEREFPTVSLRLHVEALGAVAQAVHRGIGAVGFGGGTGALPAGLERVAIGEVDMIPVAAPDHPAATSHPGPARGYRQLVLTVRSSFEEGPDNGIFSRDQWHLADLGAKHALLLGGCGWGNMPEPHVRDDLACGRLVRLQFAEFRRAIYPFHALFRSDTPPGPAARWLIEHFVSRQETA